MHTSARSAFLHCSRTTSLTSRTAVYGPVRTVVWQGSAGDCRPYADQTPLSPEIVLAVWTHAKSPERESTAWKQISEFQSSDRPPGNNVRKGG